MYMQSLPDIIRHIDLPDLAAAIAPRALFIVEPLDGARRAASRAGALKAHALAERVCRAAGEPDRFILSVSPSDEDMFELLRDWSRRAI